MTPMNLIYVAGTWWPTWLTEEEAKLRGYYFKKDGGPDPRPDRVIGMTS